MRAYFCGTRGSTPVSGAEQLHYGGYTSCIGLAHAGEPPTIVLDAGTGLQQLPLALGDRAFRGTLLLSHLHWDHTHGMPFFRSGALPGQWRCLKHAQVCHCVTYVTIRVTLHLVSRLSNILDEPNARPLGRAAACSHRDRVI